MSSIKVHRRVAMIVIVARCMAIAFTCKFGASGSWPLGGTMVMVFYVFVCVLCVVVERWLVLGIRSPMCMICGISIIFSKYDARMVLDNTYVIT